MAETKLDLEGLRKPGVGKTTLKQPIDFSHPSIGGKQILAAPASNPAGKPVDFSHLGGTRLDAPNAQPEATEAQSDAQPEGETIENENEGSE
jgi:hypothetical protein